MDSTYWLAELIEDIMTGFGPELDPHYKTAVATLIHASYIEIGLITPLHLRTAVESSSAEIIPYPLAAGQTLLDSDGPAQPSVKSRLFRPVG